MEESAAAETLEISEVFQRLRSQTGQLLEDGATPSEVSFALAYIAAELGFVVAPDPLCVIPVVLKAVSEAASQQWKDKNPQQDKDFMEQPVQPGETIQ